MNNRMGTVGETIFVRRTDRNTIEMTDEIKVSRTNFIPTSQRREKNITEKRQFSDQLTFLDFIQFKTDRIIQLYSQSNTIVYLIRH
mmetsp:Transcript_3758/g.10688  ORF Transcript_3758/g.10688 Transcript_3758/m.10688 type:complete len:86 (-) Transcript_3758:2919-3176(-)